ncbi:MULTISPECIES: transcriptional repressor LexA [Caproicibacterium]|uniref:LexA repressor n=1 Tax=Caproicibacterium argilliputei TaxID=3030016 RepID=A0AA97H1J3_9FIRM|nr:transcriptional repressor LexA [Caproicibacterium argilliputei]WOC31770.1 transcriptional repressor LexA [Caproicibacterium argilliputei]
MLTASQQKVYDYLKSRSRTGLPPTVREICAATGLKSTSSVHAHLKTLERKGYITRDAGLNRAIHITGDDDAIPLQVPLLGRVAAGQPILATEEIEGYIPYLPPRRTSDATYFALNVRGESMRDIGILNRDIVIVKQTPTAEDGEIVVAMIDGEATVKRIFREPDRIRLQPENPEFSPIYAKEVTILGRVVALVRNY